MIDAHTHLTADSLNDDVISTVSDFVEIGGTGLVTQSMDDDTFRENIRIVNAVEDADIPCIIKTTWGWHPYEVVMGHAPSFEEIYEHGSLAIEEFEEHVVAVGECGIDLHYPESEKTLLTQQNVLASHCRLAQEYGLPLVIHSREAFAPTMDVLLDYTDMPIYMHCRGYTVSELEDFLLDFPQGYVGLCGNVTYKNADTLRACVPHIPDDRLLIETDAPYLTPAPHRSQTNTPSKIIHTYDYIADMLGVERGELVGNVSENFFTYYQL